MQTINSSKAAPRPVADFKKIPWKLSLRKRVASNAPRTAPEHSGGGAA